MLKNKGIQRRAGVHFRDVHFTDQHVKEWEIHLYIPRVLSECEVWMAYQTRLDLHFLEKVH